jgi:hypothetical protein
VPDCARHGGATEGKPDEQLEEAELDKVSGGPIYMQTSAQVDQVIGGVGGVSPLLGGVTNKAQGGGGGTG